MMAGVLQQMLLLGFVGVAAALGTAPVGDGLEFDCPMRQLAFRYAEGVLFGRGADRVADGLALSPAPSPSSPLATKASVDLSFDESPTLSRMLPSGPTSAGQQAGDVKAGSSWVNCIDTQSVSTGTCNDPHQPCVPGSGNFNAGQFESLLACQAVCIASASNFSCRAVEWHGPSTGSWAGTCLLQQIGSFHPGGSDKGHHSACLPGGDMPSCTPKCSSPGPGPGPGPAPAVPCPRPGPSPSPSQKKKPQPHFTASRVEDIPSDAIYVDPGSQGKGEKVKGSDGNPGTLAQPFATLGRAQDAARTIIQTGNSPTIVLRQGTHYLGATAWREDRWVAAAGLRLNAQDSGSHYMSYPGETATISGGTPLRGLTWKKVASENDGSAKEASAVQWAAHVPAGMVLPEFNTLFVNGTRQIRARFPNGDPVLPGSGFDLSGQSIGAPSNKGGMAAWPLNVDVNDGASQHIAKGATKDGNTRSVSIAHQSKMRPTYNDFGSNVNGTSSRFDHTYNTDFWGQDTIEGVKGIAGLKQWKNPETAIVHMYHPTGWGGWMFQVADQPTPDTLRFLCKTQDTGKLIPCTTQDASTPVWVQGGWQEARGGMSPGKFYVENVYEELDAAKEWFFDKNSSTLYYQPEDGAEPSDLLFVATSVNNVVEVRDAQSIHFSGITFTQSQSTFLDVYEVPSGGDWSIHRGATFFVEDSEKVSVVNCIFDQVGGNALMLSNAVVDSVVANSTFLNIGDSAMVSLGSTELFDGTVGKGKMPRNNVFQNNLVDTVGVFGKQTSAYFKGVADSNTFENNVIMNGPRAGINFNDGAAGGENMIGNLILNFVRESGDHGMFNSWDRQPFLYTDAKGQTQTSPKVHQIRGNFCFNKNYATNGQTRSGYCMDYDDGSSQYNATNNVFLYGGFKIRDGVNRSHDSNLIVAAHLADPQVAGFDSTTLTNNIAVMSGGDFYGCVGDAFGQGTTAAGNKFFTPGDPTLPFSPGCNGACQNLSCWQQNGPQFDKGSTISDTVTVAQLIGWASERLGMPSPQAARVASGRVKIIN